jgi:hypothetical protein
MRHPPIMAMVPRHKAESLRLHSKGFDICVLAAEKLFS